MAMSPNVLGICEVPPIGEIWVSVSKLHIRLLGVDDSPEVSASEQRIVDRGCPSQIIKGVVQSLF